MQQEDKLTKVEFRLNRVSKSKIKCHRNEFNKFNNTETRMIDSIYHDFF